MNTLQFKRNYKFLLGFFLFLILCLVFGGTRIISYNFGTYSTELQEKIVNIENSVEAFDDTIIHDVTLDISSEDYEQLILFYKQNNEKEYLQTNVTIDGVKISDVGIKLKGNQIILQSIDEINIEDIDFSFQIKFDKYVTGQRYQGMSELSLISGELSALKGEYIAGELYNSYGVIAPEMSFTKVVTSDLLSGTYLIKEVVDEIFLSEKYLDDYGLLYKAENSLSFSYGGDDPVLYTDLFTQKTLVNNYDLMKLISVLEFVSESGDTSFVDEFTKYIDIENYTKFLAINKILYPEDDTISLLNSYYIYYDLNTETIKFIPWDSEYVLEGEESSMYEILAKVFSKQEIANLEKRDIRGILDNYTETDNTKLKQKYVNDLENRFLDSEGFKILFDGVKEGIEGELKQNNFLEEQEEKLDTLLFNI